MCLDGHTFGISKLKYDNTDIFLITIKLGDKEIKKGKLKYLYKHILYKI